jgi:Nucleotidyl transferase AbiEii toxin, Type IV TA system
MDKVALLDASDRAALFGETGAARGIANTIVEKDFWVCWTLKRLFELQNADAPTLIFKGGTSLSKAFGAIRRFSEDIDLSFDRAELGYTGDRDPEKDGISRKQAAKLIDDLVGDVEEHVKQKLMPALRTAIAKHIGEPWSLEIDESDRQTVNFHYPTALSKEEHKGMAYITPRVKLEFGACGDPWPTEEKAIRPYAADDYPDFFENPDCTITVLSARRTFWEKATALHAEAHRPKESPMPQSFARHYYDIAMLLDTEDGKAAATDFELLERVAKHKAVFFRSAWANYDTARPGTLRLMPSAERLKDLRADYRDMAPMMFDDKPLSFDEILVRIQTLQDTINLASSGLR